MATPPKKPASTKSVEELRKERQQERRELNATVSEVFERTRKKPA